MKIPFDGYGTPTIKQDRENEIFAGVAIIYEKTDEKKFFEKVEEFIGLKKSKPVKNDQISPGKAIEIAEILALLPFISICSYY